MKPAALILVLVLSACAPPAPRCAGLAGAPALEATLYFGRLDHGAKIDDAAWRDFLAAVVTPRFPDGFTVLDGHGQWRQRASGRISAEPSTVIVVVAAPGQATLDALEAIRAEYRRRFSQESVGLTLADTCASF